MRILLLILLISGLFWAKAVEGQILFEQVPPPPPAPQNIADFEGVIFSSVAFADIDADGDQDVLITGSANFEFISRLYINNGLGSYALLEGTPFDGVSTSSVAFADIDGDGDPDVLITGWNDFECIAKLYTNDGLGAYTLLSGTPFEGVKLGCVAFADVDGDDDFDVLITGRNEYSESTAKLYANDGIGGYSLVIGTPFDEVESGSIAFADVDADADIDVLITGYNNGNLRIAKLYTNNGSGGYSLEIGTPFDGGSDGSVAFADIDGDSDLDLLITGLTTLNERTANLYTNDGNGGYVLAIETPFEAVSGSTAVFADVDQDDDQDIMIIGFNGSSAIAQLYVNNGAGTYELAINMPFDGVESGSIAFADVDGDGDLDVLITGFNNTVQNTAKLYVNNGIEGFMLVIGTPFDGVNFSSIAFADLDGDEDQDVVITGTDNLFGSTASLYTNDGIGGYQKQLGTPFDRVSLSSIAIADVDGDNDQDLLITGRNELHQRVSRLYINNGLGGFTLLSGTPFDGADIGSVAFADVDGDGDPDILITGRNQLSQRIAKLYTNNGFGEYSLVIGTPFEGVSSGCIAFADVDGDNDLDVMITGSNLFMQAIANLYLNDGMGGYTLADETPFDGVVGGSVAFADVDGDGDQDVLITGGSGNSAIAQIYINDGTGNYTLVNGTSFAGVANSSIAFADVDGDNDPDVLITGTQNVGLSNAQHVAKLYINDSTGWFTLISESFFEGVENGSIAFADIDGDDDPDVLITGLNNLNQSIAKLYRNNSSFCDTDTECTLCVNGIPYFQDADGDGVCDSLEVSGCDTPEACNFDPAATENDGSCLFATAICEVCVDEVPVIFDADGDQICDQDEIAGCMDLLACNFNPEATDDDGSCLIIGNACSLVDESDDAEGFVNTSCICQSISTANLVVNLLWWFDPCGPRILNIQLQNASTGIVEVNTTQSIEDGGLVALTDLPAGNYNIRIKVDGFLSERKLNQLLPGGITDVSFIATRRGDINGDNFVNIIDISLLNLSWASSEGSPTYNPLADLTCDGQVNIIDVSLLNAAFGQMGASLE